MTASSPRTLPASEAAPTRNLWPALVPIFAGFALTGVANTLLGPVLPALAEHLGLRDAQAGLLFTAQFFGSSLGAVLSRGKPHLTMTAGYALLSLCAASLAFLSPATALPAFFFFGLSYGIAMTATNLLVSRRASRRRGAALSLLNFCWSIGALLCPLAVARLLAWRGLHGVFLSLAAAALAASLLLAIVLRPIPGELPGAGPQAHGGTPAGRIAYFALLAFLYVGVEATIGGWLSTYAHRLAQLDPAHAAAVSSYFWGTFLAGRGLSSLLLLRLSERRLLPLALLGSLAGMGLILAAGTASALSIGAIVVGLAMAPTFSLLIALFISGAKDPGQASWIFALCGFGGSSLPWLTGAISAGAGSLRLGLTVPAAALLLMLAMVMVAMRSKGGYLRAGA